MARDDLRNIHILQSRSDLYGSQSGDRVAPGGGSKEVAKHPIIRGVAIHESPGNCTPHVQPSLLGRSNRCAKDKCVLDYTVGFDTSELDESIEDRSSTEREADQRDGTDTWMSLD